MHHGTQRAGGLAAAADDFAEIDLGNFELVDVRGALFDELDADLVRPIHEVHREVTDQLGEVWRTVRSTSSVAFTVAVSTLSGHAIIVRHATRSS